MPVDDDPSSGGLFIWIISCFLFISVTLGGSLLITYLILPPSPSTDWLPIAGVSLVCLPWGFWFFTCFYRVLSRALGFRVVIGGCCGGGRGDDDDANEDDDDGRGPGSSFKGPGDSREEDDPNRDHPFAGKAARTAGGEGSGGDDGIKRTSGSGNGVSVASNESEIPLTSGVGS